MSDELNNSLTSVAKGAGIVLFGLIVGNFLGMAYQIILGRILGPEMYGLYNLAMSVATIASSFSVFGLLGALARFIPFHLKRGETEIVRSTIDFSSIFVFSSGIILAIVLFVLADYVAVSIFSKPELATPLRIFAFGIPVLALQRVMRGITRGFKAVKYNVLVFNIGDRVIKIAFFLVSMVFIYRLYGAICALIAGSFTTTILIMWLIRFRIFPEYSSCRRTPVARSLLSFSWPLALTGFTFLFVSKTDKILLGYYLSSEDVGIYSPALVIAGMLVFVAEAFKYIFLPTVSEHFANKDISGLELLFKSTSKWIFLIVLPMFFLIMLFPREIITLLYGSKYVGGYMALIILSLGIAMNDLSGTAGNILVGGGHTKLNLICEVIAAATNIVLNIILIPRYGIVGAAAATGISYMTRNISSVSFVWATFRMHPYRLSYLRILFSGAVAAGIIFVLKMYSPLPWLINMLLLGCIFILIFLMLAVLTRSFDKNDKIVLEAVERKSGINLGFIKKFI